MDIGQGPDRRTWSAFAGAVLIGGANFVAVSMSNEELPPLFGATLRFGCGALLFLILLRLRGVPLAKGKDAAGAALYGALGFGLAYACAYYALVELSAGTVSVVFAAVPLATLAMAVLLKQERLTGRGLVGGMMAVVGIGVLSIGSIAGGPEPRYLAAAIFGTLAVAASSVVVKSLFHVHPLNLNAVGMVAGTALLATGSLLLGERWQLPREPRTWAAVGWLVVLGSLGLFQLFLYVMRRWTASATVYAIAAMPLVAVALGAVLLGQPVTRGLFIGGTLVIGAVYIGAAAGARRG